MARRTPSDERAARLMRALASLAILPVKEAREVSSAARDNPSAGNGTHQLVVAFDDAYTSFVEGFEALPSESQMVALQAVDTKVSAMVGAKDVAIWTDRARREDQVWIELRELAEAAIGAFARQEPETVPGVPSQ